MAVISDVAERQFAISDADDINIPASEVAAASQGLAIRGASVMVVRQVVLTLLTVGGSIILARLLSPADFGLYAVVGTLVNVFNVIGDVGLGAALIQQPKEPSSRQLCSVFTIQLIIALILVALTFVASPLIIAQYRMSPSYLWLVRAISLSLLFASLRSVPGMLLERRMKFGAVATIDMVQALGYNVLAVMLALVGLRVWSLVIATLVSSLAGLFLAYRLMSWRPSLMVEWVGVRHLVRFGLSFQSISIISLIKDSFNPLLIGSVVGLASVGYINWAIQVASYPVIVVWVINKVTFPLFARLQHDPAAFRASLELFMRANAVVSYGFTAPILVLAPYFTPLVFGSKWLPAIPVLYLLSFAVFWIGPGLPVGNAMSAIGRSGTVLRFSILWMVLTWVLGIPLVLRFGLIGFGLAHVAVQFTNIFVYRKLRERYVYQIWPNILVPLLSLFISVGTGWVLTLIHPPVTVISLVASCAIVLIVYLGTVCLSWWRVLNRDLRTIRMAFFRSPA